MWQKLFYNSHTALENVALACGLDAETIGDLRKLRIEADKAKERP